MLQKTWKELKGLGNYVGLAGRLWEIATKHLYIIPGSDPVWDDVQADFGASRSPSVEFDWVQIGGSGSVYRPAITGKVNEEGQFVLELLHGYEEGTDIYPHFHWMPSNVNTGSITFQLDYRVSRKDAAVSSLTSLTKAISSPGVAWQGMANEFDTPISGAGMKIGDQIMIRFTGTKTTFTGDVALLTLGMHIKNNSRGSAARFVK